MVILTLHTAASQAIWKTSNVIIHIYIYIYIANIQTGCQLPSHSYSMPTVCHISNYICTRMCVFNVFCENTPIGSMCSMYLLANELFTVLTVASFYGTASHRL